MSYAAQATPDPDPVSFRRLSRAGVIRMKLVTQKYSDAAGSKWITTESTCRRIVRIPCLVSSTGGIRHSRGRFDTDHRDFGPEDRFDRVVRGGRLVGLFDNVGRGLPSGGQETSDPIRGQVTNSTCGRVAR